VRQLHPEIKFTSGSLYIYIYIYLFIYLFIYMRVTCGERKTYQWNFHVHLQSDTWYTA